MLIALLFEKLKSAFMYEIEKESYCQILNQNLGCIKKVLYCIGTGFIVKGIYPRFQQSNDLRMQYHINPAKKY